MARRTQKLIEQEWTQILMERGQGYYAPRPGRGRGIISRRAYSHGVCLRRRQAKVILVNG